MKYGEAIRCLRRLAEKSAVGPLDDVAASVVLDRITDLEAVADAAASLRDSNRVGLIDLVLRDERRLDEALAELERR